MRLVILDNDERFVEYMNKIWQNKHAVISTYLSIMFSI